MTLTVANKALIGVTSIATLSGVTYGAYSLLTTTETVKEVLLRQNKNPFNLDEKTEEDTELLKELAKQYHTGSPKGKEKIKNFELTSANDFQGLETKCRELLNTKASDKDFDSNLKHASNWCSKDKAPQSVKNLLKAKGRELLQNNDGDKWNTPWKAFKTTHSSKAPEGDWTISDWDTVNKTDSPVAETFKTRCAENGEKSLIPNESNAFLKQIEDYCTKKIGEQ